MKGYINMSVRQFYLSLFSSAFLFGSSQALIAMETEDKKTHLSTHPSLSSSDDESTTELMDLEAPLEGGSSSLASADDRSTEKNKVIITDEDKEKFNLITTSQNPLLTTNEQLDNTQGLLSAPLKVELSLEKYLKLKDPEEEEGANPSIFIGLLENGTKVVIKRNKYFNSSKEEIVTSYELEQATLELVAPKIARAYFDVPTLPPVAFLGDKDHFEVRQYFIEGETSEKDEEEDVKKRMELSRELYLNPESFNRPFGFIDFNVIAGYFLDDLGYDSDEKIRARNQTALSAFLLDLHFEWPTRHKFPQADLSHLKLFDLFIAAADRNNTQHLFIPCTSTQNEKQKWAYFGIDYAETYYNSRQGIVDMSDVESSESEEEFEEEKTYAVDTSDAKSSESEEEFEEENPQAVVKSEEASENAKKWTAPLSAVNKLKRLHENYRDFFKETEQLAPGIYNDTYFKALKEYQEVLLNKLVGIEI